MLIDTHTHVVPELPDFAERYGDGRWPTFVTDGQVGTLLRGGEAVRTVPRSAWDVDTRLAEMDAAGVDVQVMSPLPPLICDWADPEPASEWCVRLNDDIASTVHEHDDRLRGLGTVPLQAPVRAVQVLERAHESGLVGVEIGASAGGRELDHEDLTEFFVAAAELQMVVFVHPLLLESEPGWTPRITGAAAGFGLGMTTDTAIAATKLVFGGVAARSPELRILLAHGGGTFVWALTRIRHALALRGGTWPEELIDNLYVDSVVYDEANLRFLLDVLGADHVVFGTDYPLPAQDDVRGGLITSLVAEEADRVAAGTAARLFGVHTQRKQPA